MDMQARIDAADLVPDRRSPTVPPPQPKGLSRTLTRNMDALHERRRREEARATRHDRAVKAVVRFTGSLKFLYLHVVIFGLWIGINSDLLRVVPVWDRSFVLLGTFASVEAIFLSTLVLISQNRMSVAADRRADLDLQISLLSEHELTKLVTLVGAIARRLEVRTEIDDEVAEIQNDVAPEAVLDALEAREDSVLRSP